jgi:hypothetical protein
VSVYRRILRGADGTHPHWVALEEENCIGESFHALRKFCGERGLSLSRHGHSVNRNGRFFQVFMFAEEEHAEIFREAFGGERMHRSERRKGTRWSQWKKSANEQKPKRQS